MRCNVYPSWPWRRLDANRQAQREDCSSKAVNDARVSFFGAIDARLRKRSEKWQSEEQKGKS
eukprot:3047369-Pleurochrysis_carterae.AAC.1